MRQHSFDHDDVCEFLDNECSDMEICDLSSEHPFRNPWHNGSWRAEVADLWERRERDRWPHIADADVSAFIDAVGEEAFMRGYDTGCSVYEGAEEAARERWEQEQAEMAAMDEPWADPEPESPPLDPAIFEAPAEDNDNDAIILARLRELKNAALRRWMEKDANNN